MQYAPDPPNVQATPVEVIVLSIIPAGQALVSGDGMGVGVGSGPDVGGGGQPPEVQWVVDPAGQPFCQRIPDIPQVPQGPQPGEDGVGVGVGVGVPPPPPPPGVGVGLGTMKKS